MRILLVEDDQMIGGALQKALRQEGYAVIRYSDPQEVKDFKRIMTKPYRGRQLGIFVSQDFLQPSRQDPLASD
jgi:FixJ family two-component response regulator